MDRWSYPGILLQILAMVALVQQGAARPENRSVAKEEKAPVVFVDVTEASGLRFVHDNAATPEKYLIETMGAGCGWIDYDNDGYLDLYLVNSAGTERYRPPRSLRGALYRNNGNGTFTDVTEKAAVGAEGLFGMGVAVGDYDGDGWPDLYVMGHGRSMLYRNQGDRTFRDVTARAGVSNTGKWGSSGAWFDFDNDSHLDLVIANYVQWSVENNAWCGEKKPGYRAYCHPNVYPPQRPTLYRNNGDGTFSDVSKPSGIAVKAGNGLGVVTFDFDQDGWQDIFIANDTSPNFLFRNRGDGTFEEMGYLAGVAVSEDGKVEAGMGTDAADLRGTGRMDIYVTHLDYEHDRLYYNLPDGSFQDATFMAKLGFATWNYSGFGVRLIDYDHDGHRDIVVANGHIMDNIHLYHADTAYAEPKAVFRNNGRGVFENVTSGLGLDMMAPRVSRGLAAGDFDNDGDLDLLVSNNGQPVQLFRNDGGNRGNWLQIFLIGTRSNRDGVGARVKVFTRDGLSFDERKGGMSYQSAQDPRLHFGLGSAEKVDRIEIRWPSGIVDQIENIQANQTIAVEEGNGLAARGFPPLGASPP